MTTGGAACASVPGPIHRKNSKITTNRIGEMAAVYTRKRKWSLVLPALVAGSLVLTGCTKPDPEVTYFTDGPMPTETATSAPTTEAPSDPSQTSPDEARNAYLNYVDVGNEVSRDYLRGWDTKYLNLTIGEERESLVISLGALADLGFYQVGDAVVKTIPEILEYDDTDPLGNYRAEVKACVDTSSVEWVAEGSDILQPRVDGQFYSVIIMQRTVNYDAGGSVLQDPYGQGWWRVASEHGDPEKPC